MNFGNERGELANLTNELAEKDKSTAAFLIDILSPGGLSVPAIPEDPASLPNPEDMVPGALGQLLAVIRGVEVD